MDARACYLLLARVCTYAPRGATPILQVSWSHDVLSVSGGLPVHELVLQSMQPHGFAGAAIAGLLRYVRRPFRGQLLVL